MLQIVCKIDTLCSLYPAHGNSAESETVIIKFKDYIYDKNQAWICIITRSLSANFLQARYNSKNHDYYDIDYYYILNDNARYENHAY